MYLFLLIISECYAATAQVVGRELHLYAVAGDDADVVLAHLAADSCEDGDAVVKFHAEILVAQRLDDLAVGS